MPIFPISLGKTIRSRATTGRGTQGHGIYAKPYFYPRISEFPMYRGRASARSEGLPVATRVAQQVLCLPIYPELPLDDVDAICRIIER